MPLTPTDRDMIVFARRFWLHAGNRESAIRAEFGISETAYWQQLNRIVDEPAALEFDPFTTRRIQRLRDSRQRSRRVRRA